MPSLPDLESKYLDVTALGPPIYRGNTQVTALIHGAEYFPAIYNWINKTNGASDFVFIVGWQIDPDLDLTNGQDGGPNALAPVLLHQARLGVDVRLVLNGTPHLYWVKQAPWMGNLEAALKLRRLDGSGNGGTPPLSGSVLFDWSGAEISGSHHQKATVVRSGNDLVAFVGGMDMVKDHWDSAPHPAKSWPDGSSWGWHDIGVQLYGEAAKGVWANFCHRWTETSTLEDRNYTLFHNGTVSTEKFNPSPIKPTPDLPLDTPTTNITSQQSVQILRSRYRWKIPTPLLGTGVDWVEGPKGGLYQVYNVLKKAISAATRYIYIEDQFLDDTWNPEEFLTEGPFHPWPLYSLFADIQQALTTKNDLRVIFVGSGKSDPIDLSAGPRNLQLSPGIKKLVQNVPAPYNSNIAVWHVSNVTVHSKLMLIDDEFAAIGSANFHSRSMFATDEELHTAIVAEDDWVQQLRCRLWAEHWRISDAEQQTDRVLSALKNIDTAIGLWRPVWSGDTTMWRTANNPPGFAYPRPSEKTDEANNPYGGIAPVPVLLS